MIFFEMEKSAIDSVGNSEYNKDNIYTEEQYDNFGWAKEVGAITSNELDDLYSAIKIKKRLSDYPISSQNE